MKHLLTILTILLISHTSFAQKDINTNSPGRNMTLSGIGFPGSIILIPLNNQQTAYYIKEKSGTIDIHITPNDSLHNIIANWKNGLYKPKDYTPQSYSSNNVYIKPYSTATKDDILNITDILLAHKLNSIMILKLKDKEMQIVSSKL